MKHTKLFRRLAAGLLAVLMLLAAMPAAMAQPGPTTAPNRCTGNPDGNHYWGKWKTKKEATCEKEGKKERKCRYCSRTDTKKIKKADHKWGEWTVIKEATDRSMGQRERTCTVCGTTKKADFYPEGTLKRGDKGDAVKALQNALNAKGYDCGKADGGFGKKTEKAVKAFEPTIGITGDGIAWPAVIAALSGTAVTLPDNLASETDTTTYDLPNDRPMVTLTIYGPEGKENIEVEKGAPTYLNLPSMVGDTYVDWVVLNTRDPSVYTNQIYKDGMSFYAFTAIGYKEQSVTLTLLFRGGVVAKYHVEAGKLVDYSSCIPPYMVLDDMYIEWYDTPEYNAKTSKPAPMAFRLTEDTIYYGIVMGYASSRLLTKDEYVYPYKVSNTADALLPAGTQVLVISSEQSTANFYSILYEDNGVMKRGYLINAQFDEDERMIYLDANGGTVEPSIIPFTFDIHSFPTPTTESEINNKFVRWELVDGLRAGEGVNVVFRAVWEPEYTFKVSIDEPLEWNSKGVVTSTVYSCPIGKYPNNSVMDFELPKGFYSLKRGPIPLEVTGWEIRAIDRPGEGFQKVSLPFTPGEKLTGSIWLKPTLTPGHLFTITYDMGPFAPRESTTVKSWETDYVIPDPEPVDGYEFTGWWIIKRTNPDTGSIQVGASSFTPGQKITSDITLQAQYKQTKWYTIHFDAGQGNAVKGTKYYFARHLTSKKTRPDGTLREEDIPSAIPGDKNLNFDGWKTADGEWVHTDTVFTKDTTVYASWSSNPTVSFIKSKR